MVASEEDPVDLLTESSILDAIRSAISKGRVPSYSGYSSGMLDGLIDGTKGIGKHNFAEVVAVLRDLGVRYYYLWSPHDQERADRFKDNVIPPLQELDLNEGL